MNNEEINSAEKLEKQTTRGPGSILAAAREQAGLSVKDVAQRLFLTPMIISAIEKDAYDNAGGIAFVKGYLRSYAKLLNLSADKIVASFEGLGVTDKPADMSTQRIYEKKTHIMEKSVSWITGVVVVLILLSIIFWWRAQHRTITAFHLSKTAVTAKTISNATSLVPPTTPGTETLTSPSTVVGQVNAKALESQTDKIAMVDAGLSMNKVQAPEQKIKEVSKNSAKNQVVPMANQPAVKPAKVIKTKVKKESSGFWF